MPNPALSALQRTPPPFNSSGIRRRDGSGGPVVPLIRRTLAPGMDSESTRYPGTTNDDAIVRDKTPWYPSETYQPAGQSWISWTDAGPPRPELHMRDVTLRTMQGTSNTRNLQNPVSALHRTAPGYRTIGDRIVQPQIPEYSGLHTDPKIPAVGTIARYTTSGLPQIRRGRQDRLRSGQYTGQSYSQTTIPQGG